MLFAFVEDGTLEVLADLAEALRRFEPIDVESAVVEFFDGRGRPLTAVFPHRSERRILGVRVGSDPGPYELHVTEGGLDTSIEVALAETVAMAPDGWFATLEEVRARFRDRAPS